MEPTGEFKEFGKIARLSREVIITEKIDGTNAQISIGQDGSIWAGSRTRWIRKGDDNFEFAAWVDENKSELIKLGPGLHYGEWWGRGIQRGYGIQERRFSLFNIVRWCLHGETPKKIPTQDPRIFKTQEVLPSICQLVPVLYRGVFDTNRADEALTDLSMNGSKAAPGFMAPEGIVVWHVAANMGFKKTLENDGLSKSLVDKIQARH